MVSDNVYFPNKAIVVNFFQTMLNPQSLTFYVAVVLHGTRWAFLANAVGIVLYCLVSHHAISSFHPYL